MKINNKVLENTSIDFPQGNDLKKGFLQVSPLLKMTAKSYFYRMVNPHLDQSKKPAFLIGAAVQKYMFENLPPEQKELQVILKTNIEIKRTRKDLEWDGDPLEKVSLNLEIRGAMDFLDISPDSSLGVYECKYSDEESKRHQAMLQCMVYAEMLYRSTTHLKNGNLLTLGSHFHPLKIKVKKPREIWCRTVVVGNNTLYSDGLQFDPEEIAPVMEYLVYKASIISEAGHYFNTSPDRCYRLLENFDTRDKPYYNAEKYIKL